MSFKETLIGKIPTDWELYELKDKVNIVMGQSPKSEFYNKDKQGIPFMQGRTTFGDKYHEIDTWCTDPKKFANKSEVLMSVRAPVGDVNIATMDLCIGRGLASLSMKNGNNEYLYYLMKNYVELITSKGSGTVFSSINKNDIETLKLPFASDEEQQAIANILSSLDEKIELNNQMNKTLEEMAQALFKRWFVDFEFPNENGEPYKSSGGEMVDSELGMIPKGWKVLTVGEMELDISDGNYSSKYPTKREFIDEGIAFIRGTDFQAKTINRDKLVYISLDKHNELKKGHTKENDILITTRGEVGMIAYVPKTLVDNNINAQLVRVNGGRKYSRAFLGNLLESKYVQEDISSLVTGSALQQLPVGNLKKVKVIIPSEDIRSIFDDIAIPITDKIELNNEVSYSVQRLRDTLLPKLMSGEIRVTDLQN